MLIDFRGLLNLNFIDSLSCIMFCLSSRKNDAPTVHRFVQLDINTCGVLVLHGCLVRLRCFWALWLIDGLPECS